MEQNHEILVNYLDRNLNPDEMHRTALLLKQDRQAAEELEYLKLAVDTVRYDGIKKQVMLVRQAFDQNQTASIKPAAKIRTMYSMSMRIAAILILVVAVTSIYKYISVSPGSVYTNQFRGFELSNTRGQENANAFQEAYKNKNWAEVISLYGQESVHTNKTSFLTGMAEMQENHFPEAISAFANLLNKTGDDAFREDAEYYQALAFLKNHEVNKGVEALNKIKNNPNHAYYPMAVEISAVDMKIMTLKNN